MQGHYYSHCLLMLGHSLHLLTTDTALMQGHLLLPTDMGHFLLWNYEFQQTDKL